MRFRRSIGCLAGAAILVGGGLATAGPAVAADAVTQTYVDAVGVVHYVYDPATRPQAQLQTDTGAKDSSGNCAFTDKGKGAADSTSITVIDEVTFDPAACSRVVSVAVYPESAVPTVVSSSIAPQTESEASSTVSSSTRQVTPLVTSWRQKLSAWVGDPVGIHVSETNIDRTWDSTGYWSDYHHWGWWSPTGWWRSAYSQIDTSTVGDTIGDTIGSYSSGTWYWSYSLNKSGDCSALLSYHYAFG